jgi:hypothetical protein
MEAAVLRRESSRQSQVHGFDGEVHASCHECQYIVSS